MTQLDTTPAHPFAEIFPMHEGEPLWKLRDRIKANGLREDIVDEVRTLLKEAGKDEAKACGHASKNGKTRLEQLTKRQAADLLGTMRAWKAKQVPAIEHGDAYEGEPVMAN